MILKVKKLNENAIVPCKATKDSAGYDLHALIEADIVLNAGERIVIPTGIAVELPLDTAGMIYTRSGLGIKHGIHVTNGVGVIDSDYRGEIRVGLHNLSHEPYTIKPNDRIAQLVITPVISADIVETEVLNDTVRGEGGFGSTGKNINDLS